MALRLRKMCIRDRYKISGYESPEYLHQIAVYLNDKMSELQNMDSYRKQNTDQKQLLLNMNLADDFFKAKRQADKLTGDLEKKERELYGCLLYTSRCV